MRGGVGRREEEHENLRLVVPQHGEVEGEDEGAAEIERHRQQPDHASQARLERVCCRRGEMKFEETTAWVRVGQGQIARGGASDAA